MTRLPIRLCAGDQCVAFKHHYSKPDAEAEQAFQFVEKSMRGLLLSSWCRSYRSNSPL